MGDNLVPNRLAARLQLAATGAQNLTRQSEKTKQA